MEDDNDSISEGSNDYSLVDIRGNEGILEENPPTSLKTSPNFTYGRSRGVNKLYSSLHPAVYNKVAELRSSLPPAVYNREVEITEYFTDETLTHFQAYLATDTNSSIRTIDWLMDSGYTHHMYYDMGSFTNYSSYRAGIIIADGTTIWTKGRGTIRIEWLLANGSSHVIDIKNILHVPALICGLFLIYQVISKGYKVCFDNNDYAITKDDKTVDTALKQGNVYTLNVIYLTAYITALI